MAEITTTAPDFGRLQPVVQAALRELRQAGVTRTPTSATLLEQPVNRVLRRVLTGESWIEVCGALRGPVPPHEGPPRITRPRSVRPHPSG